MSRRAILATLVVVIAPNVASQSRISEEDARITIDNLSIPDAPGFILLGAASETVERPATVADFAISVSSTLEAGLPDRYAIQFAPFWLVGRPDLSYSEYEQKARGYEAIRRTLSLSVAVDRIEATELQPFSRALAFGVRAALLTGSIDTDNPSYVRTMTEIRGLLHARSEGVAAALQPRLASDARINELRNSIVEALRQEDTERAESLESELDERQWLIAFEVLAGFQADAERLRELSQSLPQRRIGPTVEVAGAFALDFPESDFDAGRFSRWGAWLNTGWVDRDISLLGVARYLWEDPTIGDSEASLDLGARFIFDGISRLSLSGEGVYRMGLHDAEDRYRLAAIIAFALPSDKKVSFTFGRDFDGSRTGNMLAVLSFVVGLVSERPPIH